MKEKQAYIYGKNAINEALESDADSIAKIFISHGVQGASGLYSKAKRNKIPVVVYDKHKFIDLEKKACPGVAKTQGIIALKNLVDVLSVEDLIKIGENKKNPVVVILDELNDPHNLGAIARSAECSGAIGLLMPDRNSVPVTPVAIKSSAGALEHLAIARANNLTQAIEKLKKAGYWIVGTDASGDRLYTEPIYNSPIGLIIGSEGKGMRPAVAKQCDFMVKIPLLGKINSLNASVSAGVMLFEILRQKLD